ncbi:MULTISPECIES: alcohol dehydrogenase catalytic domain-containing protein [unclassified Streptomyces]|uniref:alcohol dehydrogenase catalytic domain-containing protein n=1 Tax=unclassified Streptomyces TaxID=2593676 RepID=UPI0038092264
MRAVVLRRHGGPEVLEFAEIPDPVPGPGEVRVRVASVVVARTKDVATRAGRPPFAAQLPGLPHVLGTEHAGTVDAVGPGADPELTGRRVAVSAVLTCGSCRVCARGREEACDAFRLIGVHRQGSYAEYCVVPEANVQELPDGVGFAQGAALAANGGVAAAQLDAGEAGPGDTVLVVGAAGALGSTAAALAAFRGATVIGVDRLADRPDRLDGLPLAAALDGAAPDLGRQILDRTDGHGVDVVVDNLGLSALWHGYRDTLAPLGRIITSGAIDHTPVELRLLPFYLRSQSLIGVRTGNRRAIAGLWADVAKGFLVPGAFVHTLPWNEVARAHRANEEGTSLGQAVLSVE